MIETDDNNLGHGIASAPNRFRGWTRWRSLQIFNGSLSQTASFILFTTSAWAGIIAAYLDAVRIGSGRFIRGPLFEILPAPQVGQLPHKRPAVVEKNPVALTEIVQSFFTIRGTNKAVLGALAVTQIQDLAVPAITG